MTKTAPGPKELHLRAQREEKAAARPRELIPYAGKEKYGSRPPGSPYSRNPKPKEKTDAQT